MIVICPDTNSLRSDPLFRSKPAQALLDGLVENDVEVHFSPVVIAELRRQEGEQLGNTKLDLRSSIEKRYRSNHSDGDRLAAAFDELVDKMGCEFESELTILLSRTGVSIDDYPAVSAEELVSRDLERRRPFQERGDEKHHYSTGMRDALLWEGILRKAARSRPDDRFILVTVDSGFLAADKRSLHTDLLEDLKALGISSDRVLYAPNLYQVNTVVAEVRKTISEAYARAAKTATLNLVSLEGELVGPQLQHGGDYGIPEEYQALELPTELEDAKIVAVDQDGEASVERQEDGTFVVRIPATLSIEGAMYISDWFALSPDGERDSDLELSEYLSDHYVEVTTSRRVLFGARISQHSSQLSTVHFDLTAIPFSPEDEAQIEK